MFLQVFICFFFKKNKDSFVLKHNILSMKYLDLLNNINKLFILYPQYKIR
ncbi:hypothetical protein FLACOL_01518 [Flavobacterium columnare]|uniref:Uncharacterized protein n=1 Tax=Flavobacterium columnare TaxID=996 RepID=A0A2N9PB22_9FLAO|nr:hypothetical protein FLACOL_01518 [Flavobacterium columnare]